MELRDPNAQMEGYGLCFICEDYMPGHGKAIVDTGREFDPLGTLNVPLSGKKLVCENCVIEMARALDMAPKDEVAAATEAIRETQAQVRLMRVQLDSLGAGFNNSADAFSRLPVTQLAVTDKSVAEADIRDKEKVSG